MKNYFTELSDELTEDDEERGQIFLLELPPEESFEKNIYFDYKLKDQLIKELNEKFKYTVDFKIQLIYLDVLNEVKIFDKSKLKDPFRSHWMKWIWSFFEGPKKRDIRYDF